MRRQHLAALLLLLALAIEPLSAKVRCTPIYIYGVAASFNDSIIYITDIQLLDSGWVESKSGFLVKRSEYTSQYRNHLLGRGHNNRTCIVTFADNEKDIKKKYAKLQKKLQGTKKHPKKYEIRHVDYEEFKFRTMAPDITDDVEIEVDKKAEKRAAKAKDKKKTVEPPTNSGKPTGQDQPSDLPPAMPPRR